MTEIQNKLLDLFKFTVSFLKEHDLKYIACGGTVLGAVRHKGFIPWDDDIDIYMPRGDYNKLLSLKNDLKQKDKDIVSIYTDNGYYLPFAKITDLNTTIWEWKELPFIIGNYIDIFPLNGFDCSNEEIIKIQKKARKLFYAYQSTLTKDSFFNIFKHLYKGHSGQAVRTLQSFLPLSSEKTLKSFIEYEKKYMSGKGAKCVSQYQWLGRVFQTSWFEDTIEVPFEDTTIVVPNEYDTYLTLLYKNWRIPPKKQISNHFDIRYYLNFKERLTLEEVQERIKNGEHCVL